MDTSDYMFGTKSVKDTADFQYIPTSETPLIQAITGNKK